MSGKSPPSPDGERIAKVLARAGVASRREAERLIAAGRVSVNGKRIERAALNVTEADRVAVDGREIGAPDPVRLWLYHKPAGLVTTTKDEQGRPTVFDELPEEMPRVMSVGRLDLNSEGLLLLTNDGAVKRRLELPATGWTRRYRVRVKGRPTDDTLAPLRAGLTLDGERFQPMTVRIDRQTGANAWLTVSLREGKKREVRRALEAVGLPVNRLIRVSYGPFQLGELKPGAVEEVKPRILRDQLGLAPEAAGAPEKSGKPARTRRRSAPQRRGGDGPGKGGQAKGAPAKSAPAKSGPGKGGQAKGAPGKGAPTKGAQAKSAHGKGAHGKGGRGPRGPGRT
ncbi:pseudouridine synthase [Rhodosalinus sediminis]|uniref:pseudouridine synthase n=1 Tax=Rhodosalinus sediminis TaxID=1940533 RepID=UPI00235624FB|nr:pseudouridine synthase [Rhodosalinus sediminis]